MLLFEEGGSLPRPKEMIEYILARVPGGVRIIDKITGIRYTTLNYARYRSDNMRLNNYEPLLHLFLKLKNADEEKDNDLNIQRDANDIHGEL